MAYYDYYKSAPPFVWGSSSLTSVASRSEEAKDPPEQPSSDEIIVAHSPEHPGEQSEQKSSYDALSKTLDKLKYLDLTGRVVQVGAVMKAHGGYCDVFIGHTFIEGAGEVTVAIKRLRIHIQSDQDFAKNLAREIRVWAKLSHPNILPLLGFIIEDNAYPSLISQWMTHGHASRYLKDHPDTDKLLLILGIAEGVDYLHRRGVVHSDLKADNVLISRSGQPQICDFGISRMLFSSQSFGVESTAHQNGTLRWTAIELLEVSDTPKRHTQETDVWAFGMTVQELFTGKAPYYHLQSDPQVMFAILRGETPPQPDFYDDWTQRYRSFYDMCRSCWERDAERRPAMNTFVTHLRIVCNMTPEPPSASSCRSRTFADVRCDAVVGDVHMSYGYQRESLQVGLRRGHVQTSQEGHTVLAPEPSTVQTVPSILVSTPSDSTKQLLPTTIRPCSPHIIVYHAQPQGYPQVLHVHRSDGDQDESNEPSNAIFFPSGSPGSTEAAPTVIHLADGQSPIVIDSSRTGPTIVVREESTAVTNDYPIVIGADGNALPRLYGHQPTYVSELPSPRDVASAPTYMAAPGQTGRGVLNATSYSYSTPPVIVRNMSDGSVQFVYTMFPDNTSSQAPAVANPFYYGYGTGQTSYSSIRSLSPPPSSSSRYGYSYGSEYSTVAYTTATSSTDLSGSSRSSRIVGYGPTISSNPYGSQSVAAVPAHDGYSSSQYPSVYAPSTQLRGTLSGDGSVLGYEYASALSNNPVVASSSAYPTLLNYESASRGQDSYSSNGNYYDGYRRRGYRSRRTTSKRSRSYAYDDSY